MEITDVRTVAVDYRAPDHDVEPERPAWTEEGPVANPMTRYPRYAAFRPSWRPQWEAVGIVVEAADGTIGLGMTAHGPAVAPIVDDHLGPRLVGEDCMATEKVYDMAVRMCAPFGAAGLAAYAVSGIDLAMWDLKGKLLDRPVYELAGGPARSELTCYATGNDTDWQLELGFEAMKLACPYGPADGRSGLDANEELIADRRQLIGDDRDLMLDCWMAFDVEYAVRLAERCRGYDLRWIEECLPPDDLAGYRALRERLPWQPITTGEHWYRPSRFQSAAADRIVDVLQPDINWVGGLTAVRRVADIAAAAGISVILHAGGNNPYGQHASLALPDVPLTEYFVATPPGVPLRYSRRLPGTAVPEDGTIVPPARPGFGIEMDAIELEPIAG